MANEDAEKLAIINEIIRLESSTNDALRSSRDEIERLEIITSQKKDTVRELEEELNAVLESKKKPKKRSFRPKEALRRMTISGYEGGDDPPNLAIFRRPTELTDSRSIARGMGEMDDDVASTTFTVGTFGNEELELGSVWNSAVDGDGDASTFCGGGSVVSHGNSHLGSIYAPMMMTVEMVSQRQALLAEKQEELKQSQEKYELNAKKLLQMQQQLSLLQRQQNSQCEGCNSNIDSLAETKNDIIARIRWREARILEEEKKLIALRKRMAEAKGSAGPLPQCRNQQSANSNPDIDKLISLTEKCADILTEFSSSIFKMIESTITLPSHSSVSYSIGLSPEDAAATDIGTTRDPSSNDRTKPNQLKGKPGLSRTSHNEEEKDEEDEQKLKELQKSQDRYGAKIRIIQKEIKSFLSSHMQETEANNAILSDLQKQVSILNDQLMKGRSEIKELVSELESLNEKERDLLQYINVPEEDDDE
jgi:hypothetical protein